MRRDHRDAKGRRWSDADRQRFADGDKLRASSRPGRRQPPPAVSEWLYEQAIEDIIEDRHRRDAVDAARNMAAEAARNINPN